MKILVDTNVLMDYLVGREPFYDTSAKIIKACSDNQIDGYMAAYSVPTLFYLLRKEFSEGDRRKILCMLCKIIDIVKIEAEQILSALGRNDFKDLEDCIQDECAISINADYIVTRNVKDFSSSRVKAIRPVDFIELFNL